MRSSLANDVDGTPLLLSPQRCPIQAAGVGPGGSAGTWWIARSRTLDGVRSRDPPPPGRAAPARVPCGWIAGTYRHRRWSRRNVPSTLPSCLGGGPGGTAEPDLEAESDLPVNLPC